VFDRRLENTMGLRGRNARPRPQAPVRPRRQSAPSWKRRGLTRAARVVAFVEALPVTKGPLAGQGMKLLPEQRRFVQAVYGEAGPDGRRLVRLAALSMSRGNGKTGLVAGLALAHLLGPEAEPRGEVYSAAVDRLQAGILFAEMVAILDAVPALGERCNVQTFHKKIQVLEGDGAGSTYEALSSDARRGHGLAPSLWISDELGQVPTRELLDALQTSTGKRAEALGSSSRRRRRATRMRCRR
jgi:phage terminase large subunit-like protein